MKNQTTKLNQEETNLIISIDSLLHLRAQKAVLDEEIKRHELFIKSHGKGKYCGHLAVATVSEYTRSQTDWKAIAEHYGYSDYMLKKNTKEIEITSLSIKAYSK